MKNIVYDVFWCARALIYACTTHKWCTHCLAKNIYAFNSANESNFQILSGPFVAKHNVDGDNDDGGDGGGGGDDEDGNDNKNETKSHIQYVPNHK